MKSDNQILTSYNPSNDQVVWTGQKSSKADVRDAIENAKAEQVAWRDYGLDERKDILREFAAVVTENLDEAAHIISEENGKPFWEAKTEVGAVAAEFQNSFDAYDERARQSCREVGGRLSVTRFRPHGVLAVVGPFNFPMSMPNLHIMPALLAGNTIVFKPSSRTPKAAEYYKELWHAAGLPEHALQTVHGGSDIGAFLVEQPDIAGILFVGSRDVGVGIEEKLAESPGKIRALEMGGNNPLVVWDYADIQSALYVVLQSAFISSGQRCTAARRLLVGKEVADEFVNALMQAIHGIVVGDAFGTDPRPFMGPLIDRRATEQFLSDYEGLLSQGARVLVPTGRIEGMGENFVRPALVDVTGIAVEDKEVFGPLLQIKVVESLDEAISESNATEYGLAAGIITGDREIFDRFFRSVEAGIINWNQPTTGAITSAPFGGVKASGNHRPTAYLAVDYCSYACASVETEQVSMPETVPPGLDLDLL